MTIPTKSFATSNRNVTDRNNIIKNIQLKLR